MPKLPAVWQRPACLPPETSLGSPRIIDIMMPYVKRTNVVIQAGAHVGLWPAVLSQHFDRVISFEPLPQLAEIARQGAPYPNVKIIETALSDSVGPRLLSVPWEKMGRYSGSSAIAEHGMRVDATTVDALPMKMTNKLGALMLDIEGHELPALRGAMQVIKKWRPVIVVEEHEGSLRYRNAGDVLELLAPLGYTKCGGYRSDMIFAVNQ